ILIEKNIEASTNAIQPDNENLTGKKILIIDDNATNRIILKSQIEKWDFIPTLAESAHQAEELLSHGQEYDMIITDMHMPEMDGLQFSKRVKQNYPNIPILLLSSVGDDAHLKQKDIFYAVLLKPVRHQSLHNYIVAGF